MKRQMIFRTAACFCVAAYLTACGGGGGSSTSSTTPAPSVLSTTISGTAATGAPFDGATVIVTDSTGATVGTTTTNPDGSYQLNFDTTKFTAPFVATVTGNIGGASESLVTVLPTGLANGGNLTANITPVTHAIASRISSTGNPLSLVDNITTEKANITSANVLSKETSFRELLTPHLTSVGLSSDFNLINSAFTANFDKLLDNIKLDTTPSGQITMSSAAGQAVDDLLASNSSPAAGSMLVIPNGVLPTAADKTLLPTLPSGSTVIGIDVLETIRSNLNSCYALLVAARPSSTECNSIISSNYKNDGRSKTAEFGTTSLLNLSDMGNTGMTFMKPEILRQLSTTRNNERLLVRITGLRRANLTDGTAGTTRELVTVVENNPTGMSGWKLVGNQRDFNTFINGVASKRIITNNQANNRFETGLNIYLQGNSGMSKAVVTGPGLPAAGITLFNRTSCDTLSISPDGVNPPSNCVSYYRLNAMKTDGSAFVPTSNTYLFATTDPARGGRFFTDAEIRTQVPAYGLYKFLITKTDNTQVTYWNRLRSQPLQTIDLARARFLDFDDATYALMRTATIYNGGIKPTVAWKTPANSPKPFKVTFFHLEGSDEQNVPFSISSTKVPCSGNIECASGGSGDYINNLTANLTASSQYMFQLLSRNQFDLQLFTQISR